MPTACRSARHHPFTRPTKHADTFWLCKHQIMRLNSLCMAGSAWHFARLDQNSTARFATHLVHAVTKLWSVERTDSTYFGYKRAVRLSYSLFTPATHIPYTSLESYKSSTANIDISIDTNTTTPTLYSSQKTPCPLQQKPVPSSAHSRATSQTRPSIPHRPTR